MNKLDTIKYQGNDYATVPVRLKEYREKNPKSDVRSTPHWKEDGSLDFETNIVRDKSDDHSMSSNGWAHYSAKEMEQRKAFEKLETISIGRALAKQGYLNNGDIATTEEMDEFNSFKEDRETERKIAEKKSAIERLKSSKSIDELRDVFTSLADLMADEEIKALKDEMKEALNAPS